MSDQTPQVSPQAADIAQAAVTSFGFLFPAEQQQALDTLTAAIKQAIAAAEQAKDAQYQAELTTLRAYVQGAHHTDDAWTAAQKSIDALFAAKFEVASQAEIYGAFVTHIARLLTADRSAAEQRGRVAGLWRAAQALCRRCQPGAEIEWIDGLPYHVKSGIYKDCPAAAIHALIAEEARSE